MGSLEPRRAGVLETGLPRSFLAPRWRASKDSGFAEPTGAAEGTGSFGFHAQPGKIELIVTLR